MGNGREVEVRFREVDVGVLKKRLLELGFEDTGEDFFRETILYDRDLTWVKERKVLTRFVRIRTTRDGTVVTYKRHRQDVNTPEAREVEFEVTDPEAACELFKAIGLRAYRTQEKKRHTFRKGDLKAEFDTWPKVQTYLELEGPDEKQLKALAEDLNLRWADVTWENAGNLIEKYYGLMVSEMSKYAFDEIVYNPKH